MKSEGTDGCLYLAVNLGALGSKPYFEVSSQNLIWGHDRYRQCHSGKFFGLGQNIELLTALAAYVTLKVSNVTHGASCAIKVL
jgi:hypothetical protein